MPGNPPASVAAALDAIEDGAVAGSRESEELELKEPVRGSIGDTFRLVAEAAICLANAGGGTVVVGIDDDASGSGAFVGTDVDVDALRQRVYELVQPPLTLTAYPIRRARARLVVVEVPRGVEIHADTKGRATRRIGTQCLPMSPTDITLLREDRRGIDWSAQPSDRSPEDVSDAAVELARQRLSRFPDTRSELSRLRRDDLLKALGAMAGDGRLVRAGELLFCAPQDAPLVIYQHRETPGGEVTHTYRDAAPTLIAFDAVMGRIDARGNAVPLDLPGGQQIELRDFPLLAAREALANATVHREYHSEQPVYLEHSPTVFTVVSPGPLVSGVTKDNILTHPPKPRNRLLAGIVHQLGLGEESGRGVDRMYREMLKTGKSPPDYDPRPLSVGVSLVGGAPNKRVARYVASLPTQERDDVDAMLVLFRLMQSRWVNAQQVAPLMQRNMEAVEAILRRLAHDSVGMIEPTKRTQRKAHPNYQLRASAVRELGPALAYRTIVADDVERRVVEYVESEGTINSRVMQIMFNLDVYSAAGRLRDLVDRGVLEKLGKQKRGPGIKYGPGPRFPRRRGGASRAKRGP